MRWTLISWGGGETCIAVLVDDELCGYEIEYGAARNRLGDIHLRQVTRVLPKIDVVFLTTDADPCREREQFKVTRQ
ncbi:MAG TPA: hypothetical protein QF813_01605 [Alphaproteobacteria bacterium]|jgi:Ribonuclease G/E|nr:hypothetical protein [Alphaproteobacteria bacterium]|tara:strand:+ start:366 stop:593 length:228 start_codon:yes stop_codon:yes gene_type:complete